MFSCWILKELTEQEGTYGLLELVCPRVCGLADKHANTERARIVLTRGIDTELRMTVPSEDGLRYRSG